MCFWFIAQIEANFKIATFKKKVILYVVF